MGFLGTVIGISSAMIDIGKGLGMLKIEGIKISIFIEAIEMGIQNLKVAFDTTLLGLIVSAVVVFLYTKIETNAEMLLIKVEEICEKKIIPLFQEQDQLLKIEQYISHYLPEGYLLIRMLLAEFRGEPFDFELSSFMKGEPKYD